MGYSMKGLAADWLWQHKVFRCQIADPAPPELQNKPWTRLPGGVLVAEGFNAPTREPLPPIRTYRPTDEADELLATATSFDSTDLEALLRFVNRWGLLGAAEPANQDQLWDSVFYTRQHLSVLRGLALRLDALKRRHWRSTALPSMTSIRRQLAGVPRSLTALDRQSVHWQAFARDMNDALAQCHVRPMLVPGPGVPGVRQTWQPERLLDVLLVTLWQNSTADDLVPRRCDTCTGVFFVSSTNTKRLYCSTRCKNLAGVRRWRQQKGKK